MLTDKDVKKLIAVFPTRDDIKNDMAALEMRINQKFDRLLTSVDEIVKQMKAYHEEMAVMRHRLERME